MTLLIAFLVFLFNNVEKQTRWAWEIIACIIWKYLLKRYTLSCNHFWRCIFRANDFWATLMSFFGRFLSNFLAMIFQLIFCLWVEKKHYNIAVFKRLFCYIINFNPLWDVVVPFVKKNDDTFYPQRVGIIDKDSTCLF